MDENRRIPIALKVVAILFILDGVSSAIGMLVSLTHGQLSINFGVLSLFIGLGLLALRPGWRACALVFLCIAMIGIPTVAIFMLGQSGTLTVHVFGQHVANAPKELVFVLLAASFLLSVWQFLVLMRDDVCALFEAKRN